ncbi:hypothetical protein BH11ACT7_BH11ACT7_36630 [soil metagenome]
MLAATARVPTYRVRDRVSLMGRITLFISYRVRVVVPQDGYVSSAQGNARRIRRLSAAAAP